MSHDTILAARRDRVLTITLNRPEAPNALDAKLTGELPAAVATDDQKEGMKAFVERRPAGVRHR